MVDALINANTGNNQQQLAHRTACIIHILSANGRKLTAATSGRLMFILRHQFNTHTRPSIN
jgi:hypothetical protein